MPVAGAAGLPRVQAIIHTAEVQAAALQLHPRRPHCSPLLVREENLRRRCLLQLSEPEPEAPASRHTSPSTTLP